MPRYVALLRGINLGRRRVRMDVLAGVFARLKFTEVATFIASGNVLFASRSGDEAALTRQIAAQLERSLGYEVETFLRTRAEIAAAAAFDGFPDAAAGAPVSTVHVAFLAVPLEARQAAGLEACRTPMDAFRVRGREFYWLCRGPSHESKVWTLPAVRALRLPSTTMRNLKTVRRLAEHYPAADAKPGRSSGR